MLDGDVLVGAWTAILDHEHERPILRMADGDLEGAELLITVWGHHANLTACLALPLVTHSCPFSGELLLVGWELFYQGGYVPLTQAWRHEGPFPFD